MKNSSSRNGNAEKSLESFSNCLGSEGDAALALGWEEELEQ